MGNITSLKSSIIGINYYLHHCRRDDSSTRAKHLNVDSFRRSDTNCSQGNLLRYVYSPNLIKRWESVLVFANIECKCRPWEQLICNHWHMYVSNKKLRGWRDWESSLILTKLADQDRINWQCFLPLNMLVPKQGKYAGAVWWFGQVWCTALSEPDSNPIQHFHPYLLQCIRNHLMKKVQTLLVL